MVRLKQCSPMTRVRDLPVNGASATVVLSAAQLAGGGGRPRRDRRLFARFDSPPPRSVPGPRRVTRVRGRHQPRGITVVGSENREGERSRRPCLAERSARCVEGRSRGQRRGRRGGTRGADASGARSAGDRRRRDGPWIADSWPRSRRSGGASGRSDLSPSRLNHLSREHAETARRSQ
jgi:hypothetical protein